MLKSAWHSVFALWYKVTSKKPVRKNNSRTGLYQDSQKKIPGTYVPGISDVNYASEGAPTGHVPAHAPQLMQVSASITYLPSPSEIAFTGQPSAQAPQAMQSSEITYAISVYLQNIISGRYPPFWLYGWRRLSLFYCNIFSEKVKCFMKIFTWFSSAKPVAVRG